MILSLHEQARMFLLCIALGGGMGLLYDCLRVFRHSLHHKRFWIQAEDALFWLTAVFLVFGVLLRANSGEVRFFSLFGLFGGMGGMLGLPLPGFLAGMENMMVVAIAELLLTVPIVFMGRGYFVNGFFFVSFLRRSACFSSLFGNLCGNLAAFAKAGKKNCCKARGFM